ncbi:NCS2 family permease [Oceanimonas baumannii]|uniref:AGZA family xanthine/uracil permease-like MFS transporter n=1 Tax=Oceanimonas baumannii TaxID=129578 RepID=A0A235C9S4_9GAMM|nr:NCS2 family permease [Oceanimonas baumannii]OYD21333.1 guanine permease [Oceanimonas baumannii]TDW55781.1 AGZA family xanthine/uracil permease-like MFS transporter [Oceanimonas baumannii]
MLEQYFRLKELNTNVRQEVVAGVTTFLTMAYIIFVNPAILSEAGMDYGAVFVATCLAAAFGCFIMGLAANYPIALAPGMGLNAFFTYTVVLTEGYSWQSALGAVFFSGCLFVLLSLFKVREWIINAIPAPLKLGIAAGIGLFLALVGLKSAGIIVDHPATLVGLGDITGLQAGLAVLGFFLIIGMAARGMRGAVMIGILAITGLGLAFGDVEYQGIVSAPPSIMPTLMQLDIAGAFNVGMLSVIFAFLFVDLFDTSGTLIAVAQRARLLDEQGRLPRLSRALLADSSASIAGSVLGTSTTTSYVESAAGVAVGGRSGLTAVVTGLMFIAALLFSPLAGMVPAYATAGALVYVAVLMMAQLALLHWDDITEAVPAVVVLVMMPFTFSIAHGIAFGFISFVGVKVLSGRASEVSPVVWALAVLFALKFAVGI